MQNISFLKKLPEDVVIPLRQHEGSACEPLVSVGDAVLTGQRIGEATGKGSSNVHASVSGIVEAIEELPHPSGNKVLSIVIKVDEEQKSVKFTPLNASSVNALSQLEIKNIIKDAGITEIYGTPTHEIIENIDTLILNVTYRSSMIAGCVGIGTYTKEVYEGFKLLMKASGAKQGAIAVNRHNKEARKALSNLNILKNTKIVLLNISYTPQMENLLVYDVMGIATQLGGKPQDAGVGVCGVNTAYEVYDAVTTGRPSMYAPVSVSGAVGKSQSILVPVGMRFKDVIASCGGYDGEPGKIIMNGKYTGTAQYTDEVPVVKQSAGILVQNTSKVLHDVSQPCTHCARCVDVCPVDIIPSMLGAMADSGHYEACREMNVKNCVECGKCAAACPSKIHLLQLIKYAKKALYKGVVDVSPKQSSNLVLGCDSCGGGN